MDVLWMRLSRRATDPELPFGRIDRGHFVVLIYRGDYWQCGLVIPKGEGEAIRARGLEAFRRQLAEAAPLLRDRADELRSWDDVKLLTVEIDRLERWYRPGLLCIGDAAHAMSPVGGVGINLAIQDAVATANALTQTVWTDQLPESRLRAVQRRREPTIRLVQALQVLIQNRLIAPSLRARTQSSTPWPVRLLQRWPALRRVPARLIGVGLRPEHVRTRVWRHSRYTTA
jgi:2-polyprenyl-6-methoxyphenol hydroxylase-like FAD-dependent oxidoreductase